MRTEVYAAFDAAGVPDRVAWDVLVEAAEVDPPFLSWDWLTRWWAAYGGRTGQRLVLIVVRNRDGGLVGVAPLYARREGGGPLSGETLRFVGTGGDTSPEHLGLVALPGFERPVAEAFAAVVARESAAFHLTDLPEDAAITGELERALRARPGLGTLARVPGAVCPYVDLPAKAEDVLGRVSSKLRYNVRSRLRKLEREHAARIIVWDDVLHAGDAIDRLAALHRQRFDAKGEAGSFASEAYLALHRAFAERLAIEGRLRLYCLEAAGSLVAMLYCFRFGARVYHFQSGFDPAWSRAGVGQVLVAAALERATAEGARRWDFLKGEYAYKAEWATGARRSVQLVGGRASLHGLRHVYGLYLRPGLGRLVRGGGRG